MPMDIIENSSGNCYCKRSDGNMDVGISIAFYDIRKVVTFLYSKKLCEIHSMYI